MTGLGDAGTPFSTSWRLSIDQDTIAAPSFFAAASGEASPTPSSLQSVLEKMII